MSILIAPLLSYLIGSMASAIVVSKLLGLPDPREFGSGNPGATNVLRSGSKLGAALTLVGDVLKGVIAVVLARYLSDGSSEVIALSGIAVVLGHMYPVFFGFKGGKGIATGFGVFLAVSPAMALLMFAVWLIVAYFTKYSSLAALIATIVGLAALIYQGDPWYIFMGFVITALIFWRHRENIKRLLNGTESRIRLSKKEDDA